MARLPKRAPPSVPAPRLPSATIERATQVIAQKWHLGPERLAWDLRNGEGIHMSPSTIKRLNLFLDPDMRTTVRALIAAMRQWRVVPNAMLFDNGAPFKGRLLVTFCRNLRIHLIHSAVNHPQTNGKLERAFRDDMKDFYRQYDEWTLESLRRDLPAYVYYRNYVRGHRALGGKPSIVRLKEWYIRELCPRIWTI
jgi:transposase InsO family protein